MSDKPLDFFTEADKNRGGKNSSMYPAWMHETQLDDLKTSIQQKEYALDNDLVAPSERMIQRDRLRQEKAQLERIENSKPQIEDLDRLAKARKYLGAEITAAMFSRREMEFGLADAHEEARRMSTPCISIKGEDILEIVKACGIDRITPDGKITRGQAEKAWKILSAFLGQISNTEVLRKEK